MSTTSASPQDAAPPTLPASSNHPPEASNVGSAQVLWALSIVAEQPSSENGKIWTGAEAYRLLKSWPKPLRDEDRRHFDQLCRKIHVSKTILDCYDRDWKAVRESQPLPNDLWCVLVAVLLAHPTGIEGDDRGRGLKYLNAALASLDRLPPAFPMPWKAELEKWCLHRELTLLS